MVKTVLQYLKVVNEVDLEIGVPFDLVQGDFMRISSIEDMAIDASRPQLLDIAHLDMQGRVDPIHELASVSEVGAF